MVRVNKLKFIIPIRSKTVKEIKNLVMIIVIIKLYK
jgi:hypothetical protein